MASVLFVGSAGLPTYNLQNHFGFCLMVCNCVKDALSRVVCQGTDSNRLPGVSWTCPTTGGTPKLSLGVPYNDLRQYKKPAWSGGPLSS
jgi:hypothetical protein